MRYIAAEFTDEDINGRPVGIRHHFDTPEELLAYLCTVDLDSRPHIVMKFNDDEGIDDNYSAQAFCEDLQRLIDREEDR